MPHSPLSRMASQRTNFSVFLSLISLTLTLLLPTMLFAAGPSAPEKGHAGEAPTNGDFGEYVEVSEVLLDVLVTDKKGNVVMGLDADDFVIRQDGERLSPTGASFYSNRFEVDSEARSVQHPAENEVPADRHFILFFHDTDANNSLWVRRQLEAARESRQWVEEEMLPGDWVAVVSYDYKLKIHSDFTRDGARLLKAIDDAARSKETEKWSSRIPETAAGQPTLLALLPDGKELRKQTRRPYDALRLIAEAGSEIIGRKNVVLFSAGFGRIQSVAGRLDSLYSRGDTRYYPALEQTLNDTNTAVYTVDLTPSQYNGVQSDFLTQLADDSGGRYYSLFTSFITPLREIADEANGYYLLNYEAEHTAGATGYRRVVVDTVNPEFRVRARQGYRYGS